MRRLTVWGALAFCLLFQQLSEMRAADPKAIDPRGITGGLVIAGGGGLPEEIYQTFMKMAGGEGARLVVVPTASGRADDELAHEGLLEPWRRRGPASVTLLHTRDRTQADSQEFVAPLLDATGVWFGGGQQARIAHAYLGTRFERELQDLLDRGGVVGGSSAGAAIQSRVMIAGGNPIPSLGTGFDLLPGAIIDQHFLARKRTQRLSHAVNEHANRFGIGIDEATALVVQGRTIRVVGKSDATVILSGSEAREEQVIRVASGEAADLVALQRAALVRAELASAGGSLPFTSPAEPRVETGSLVMVGGGPVPETIVQRMLELAGGPEAAIVVLPTAAERPLSGRSSIPEFFHQAGCSDVTVLPQVDRLDVESTEFLAAIERAKLVWFSGGRQWRFVDAYADTQAAQAFHQVLARGGVIAGSSAGATIQGDYLCRGNPLGNAEIMSEGYEQGFRFLPGVAIDQHFSQRRRFDDMQTLVQTYPQYLGIGIDEATALVVQGQVGEVLGQGEVHLYDCRRLISAGDGESQTGAVPASVEPIRLNAGSRVDLVTGQPILPSS